MAVSWLCARATWVRETSALWLQMTLYIVLAYATLLLVGFAMADGSWFFSPDAPVAPLRMGCSAIPLPC